MDNVQTVRAIYEAFGAGDIPGIIERLAEDVAWDAWQPPSPVQEHIPYLAPRRGRAEVMEFFAQALDQLEFHEFTPTNLLEGGDQVIALIRVDLTVKASGARFQDLELHLWTFDADGTVTELRHVIDTYKHMTARPAAAPAVSA
jgi:ketosteroid isomerase-like protein